LADKSDHLQHRHSKQNRNSESPPGESPKVERKICNKVSTHDRRETSTRRALPRSKSLDEAHSGVVVKHCSRARRTSDKQDASLTEGSNGRDHGMRNQKVKRTSTTEHGKLPSRSASHHGAENRPARGHNNFRHELPSKHDSRAAHKSRHSHREENREIRNHEGLPKSATTPDIDHEIVSHCNSKLDADHPLAKQHQRRTPQRTSSSRAGPRSSSRPQRRSKANEDMDKPVRVSRKSATNTSSTKECDKPAPSKERKGGYRRAMPGSGLKIMGHVQLEQALFRAESQMNLDNEVEIEEQENGVDVMLDDDEGSEISDYDEDEDDGMTLKMNLGYGDAAGTTAAQDAPQGMNHRRPSLFGSMSLKKSQPKDESLLLDDKDIDDDNDSVGSAGTAATASSAVSFVQKAGKKVAKKAGSLFKLVTPSQQKNTKNADIVQTMNGLNMGPMLRLDDDSDEEEDLFRRK